MGRAWAWLGLVMMACSGPEVSNDAPVVDAPEDTAVLDVPPDAPVYMAACGGFAPALEDCETGVYHADCGGEGGQTFACSEITGACRWFATECVAAGHVISDCPVDDRCCHTSAAGPWAFADGWLPARFSGSFAARTRVLVDLVVVGDAPVSATAPSSLEVTIDPEISAPDHTTISCEGDTEPVPPSICASAPYYSIVEPWVRQSDGFAFEVSPNLFGESLLIEVRRGPGDELVGRVFGGYETDAEPPTISPACDHGMTVTAITGGTLRIDRLELPAHGELVVTTATGTTISVVF